MSGPDIVPASPDTRHPNAPPGYPREAAARREEGDVGLIVDVAADGHAAAVQIASSSGYAVLDDAARRAVSRWHFRPAVFNEDIQFELQAPP